PAPQISIAVRRSLRCCSARSLANCSRRARVLSFAINPPLDAHVGVSPVRATYVEDNALTRLFAPSTVDVRLLPTVGTLAGNELATTQSAVHRRHAVPGRGPGAVLRAARIGHARGRLGGRRLRAGHGHPPLAGGGDVVH